MGKVIKKEEVDQFLKEFEELCVRFGVEPYRDDPYCGLWFEDADGTEHCLDE